MDLQECVEELVNDDEFFVEISDLYYEIVDDEGHEFYDSLDDGAIVPARGLDGEWAIFCRSGDYGYDLADNVESYETVITLSELIPLLEIYSYDHFATREQLADYIATVAAVK